jgi:predicted O-methyltransferase YrrM
VDDLAAEMEVSALIGGLVRGLQPNVCVELGTYQGQTAKQIGLALAANGHGHLVSFEPDAHCRSLALSACQGLRVVVMDGDFHQWQPQRPIDFAWVDHAEPCDHLDGVAWLAPLMSPRGVIAVHDTGTQFPLRDRLIKWCIAHGWGPLLLPTPRGMALLRPAVAMVLLDL